ELLESYDRSLETLVTYLERREPYLDGHAVRVAEYAVMTARRMRLPFYEVSRLRHAALLHDLGRAAVPLRVLLREGRLDEEEFEEVKKHPLEGSSRLEEVPYLSDMADAVRHHHEYYDGGGYVDHLARDTIPLGARIIAVADAYDAMTHPRPFREAKGHERAAAELRQNSGLQFDPQVVEHFLAALEEAGMAGVLPVERAASREETLAEAPEEGPAERVTAPAERGARAWRGRRARHREERLRERREARERLEREALRALEEEGTGDREGSAGKEYPGTGAGLEDKASEIPGIPGEEGS
ncbi:MAG: HD-GYP domain-containing protein, partial [Actinomycetota bacterium]|nr:HD-GYP domain-containing protein [Actinomycetota bacterium]